MVLLESQSHHYVCFTFHCCSFFTWVYLFREYYVSYHIHKIGNPFFPPWADLAQNRYFEDEAFIGYLKYLKYWQRPEYIKYIMWVRSSSLYLSATEKITCSYLFLMMQLSTLPFLSWAPPKRQFPQCNGTSSKQGDLLTPHMPWITLSHKSLAFDLLLCSIISHFRSKLELLLWTYYLYCSLFPANSWSIPVKT